MNVDLNPRQVRGLNKLGNAILPGEGEFPSFSSLECVKEVNRILDYMPAQDLADLKLLLFILSFLPQFLIGLFVRFLESSLSMKGPLGGPLRFIRIGLRGLVMTLYYGHPKIHSVIQYQVGVYTKDLEKA